MEGKTYYTLVKNGHLVYGGKDYVVGVVMGIMSTICHDDHIGPLWVKEETGDHIMQVRTTKAKYEAFVELVEKKYPGLCEFYWGMIRE